MDKKICTECKDKEYILSSNNKSGLCNYHYMKMATKRWQKKNKDRTKKTGRKYCLLKNYNMSLDEYNDLLKNQDNKCAICKKDFVDETRACVDHNHKTGKVRGLLCISCNLLIGQSYEDKNILLRTIEYLESHF